MRGIAACFSVQVFAVYREEDSELVGPWRQSWADWGWTPRLITEPELKPSVTRAILARGGGYFTTLRVFNRGIRPPKDKRGVFVRTTKKLAKEKLEWLPATVRREHVNRAESL